MDAIVAALIIIALLVLAVYYVVTAGLFFNNDFNTKKEFIFWLIPYYGIFYKIKERWNQLD